MEAAGVPGIVDQLEAVYGTSDRAFKFDPVEELVLCILSQHTNDGNSIPAFHRLRDRFPTWQSVLDAGHEELANTIRSAGLANQKARSISNCLIRIKEEVGDFNIDHLAQLDAKEARSWLERLPGVGPKTASIVLCFSLGMNVIPVDTHVFRVSWRLGLIPRQAGESKAHDLLLDLVSPDLAYRFHMALVQHGRAVCRARSPKCERCVLAASCQWYKQGGSVGPAPKRGRLPSSTQQRGA